jgi:hypothetical protein
MPAIHEEWIDAIEQIDDTLNPIEFLFCMIIMNL